MIPKSPKMKKSTGEHIFPGFSSLPKDYTDVVNIQMYDVGRGSYSDKVIGRTTRLEHEKEKEEQEERVEEEEEEESMKKGVIVKLLGRRIGYKALEARLKQMWVRKGVISLIDLSNDYYLVAFTNEEDQYVALMDGPWFIYDHYLTVKEW
ncbi:hypothetical protein L195_g036950, partial [Trifolium pratense]